MLVRVHLRRDARRAAKARLSWLRERQIAREQGPPDPAALAEVLDHRGERLGFGLYAPDAKIRVRMLQWGPEELPGDWLARAISRARANRRSVGLGDDDTTGYREINTEGDGLPGLVVDRYEDERVVQITTAAMFARRAEILDLLGAADRSIVVAPERAAKREGFTPGVWGPTLERLGYKEHGLRFWVPAPPTQKTGAYHDQRDNRALIARLTARSGLPLLDLGAHAGGFSVHAAARGIDALAVDASEPMLEFVARNAAELPDEAGLVGTLAADMFGPLDDIKLRGPFGTIVFDPPKIVSKPHDLVRAKAAMRRTLEKLLPRLAEGGLLVVCSCSHHLDGDALDEVVEAARGARPVACVGRRGPGPDHPVAEGHPEGHYLRVHLYRADGADFEGS